MKHNGFAFLNVISPCVTFNNNSGSTKSYDYVREHVEATATMDFVPISKEILASYEEGSVKDLLMHDGTKIHLHKLAKDWDPTDRFSAINAMQRAKKSGEILTGLLYIDENSNDLHSMLNTSEVALNALGKDMLCPGSAMLTKLNDSLR
jgi:2-oxoglutarate ferredoxin oxidoreductase subunit beta